MLKNNQKIPEGWSVKKLGEVFDTTTDYVAAGSFADLRDKVNYLDIPSFAQLVRTVDIKNNFNNDGFVYINQSAYDFLWRVHLDEESIILPNIGANIGEVYFLSPGKLPYSKSALGPNAILLRSSKENLFYLYCFCQTACFRNLLDLIVGASGQPKFNKTDLKTIEILLPPLAEQEKIAGILGAWDEAIEKLSNLIEQKKLLKKGLMQKLIYTQTNATKYKVADLFELGRGRVISKNEIDTHKGVFPVYSSQTSDNGILGYINTYDFQGEYITWTTDGANAGEVFYRNGKFNCTNVCGTAKAKEKNVNLYYAMSFLNHVSKKYVSYVGNPKLMNGVFAIIPLILPDIEIQDKVASVLSTADDEINLLNQKLEALKEQKKGLMQQLLTGQIRVKVN